MQAEYVPEWIIATLQDECPDAAHQTIRRCLTMAVQQFAKAGLVQPKIDIPTQAGVADYPLDELIPKGYRIHNILNVYWCGICIKPIKDCTFCPQGYEIDDLHHITMHGGYIPCEDGVDDLQIKVNLRIENGACSFPRDIERFEMSILKGTKAHLLGQKNKPWSDPVEARRLKTEYAGCIASDRCLIKSDMDDCETKRIEPECIL